MEDIAYGPATPADLPAVRDLLERCGLPTEDLRPAYLERCATPGQDVRVAVPGGEVVGRAVDVDEAGRLVVRTEAGEERLGAGDVVHVRRE